MAVATTEALELADPVHKPRLRGVSHQWAFLVSLFAGAALIVLAPTGEARVAVAIYAVSVAVLFGTSAVYHRVNWRTAAARRRMRRADHCAIFLLIAGTYTPVALLALRGWLSTAILIAVWAGAAGGVVLKLAWIDAPKPVIAAIYMALGWVAVGALPQMAQRLGWPALALVIGGGALYSIGAIIYARQRPNPWPGVFGYHEVFHALVIGAAGLHYAVVAGFVLPYAA
jgi:hemolysin III